VSDEVLCVSDEVLCVSDEVLCVSDEVLCVTGEDREALAEPTSTVAGPLERDMRSSGRLASCPNPMFPSSPTARRRRRSNHEKMS
jgi:hypothetical protein